MNPAGNPQFGAGMRYAQAREQAKTAAAVEAAFADGRNYQTDLILNAIVACTQVVLRAIVLRRLTKR